MRILRVSKTEFELENGDTFPIEPPLEKEISIEEFQKHYDYAASVIGSCKKVRGDNSVH
jgi:hypothetical protein